MYETASGRLLLAFLPPDQQEAFIDRVGLPAEIVWPEIHSVELLKQALAEIRRQNLARSECAEHVVGLAVPV